MQHGKRTGRPPVARTWIAGLLAGCLLAVSPAAAQDDEEEEEKEPDWYSRKGFYLQTLFTNNIGGYEFPSPFDDDARYSTGAAGALGYRLHKHLAAELAGDWVSGWGVQASGMDAGDLIAGAIGLNAKGYLKGERFQPFGVVGLGAEYAELRRSPLNMDLSWDMAIRLGAGFEWYFNPEVGLSFQTTYVRPMGIGDDLEGIDYVSIGIGAFLRFGRY